MAKKSKSYRSGQRDLTTSGRYRSAMLDNPFTLRAHTWTRQNLTPLLGVSDRRFFSPIQSDAFVNVVTQSPGRLQPRQRPSSRPRLYSPTSRGVPAALEVRNPRQMDTCIRRHTRREVLFALNRAGSNPGARNRTEASGVHC